MADTIIFNVRVDSEVKMRCEALYGELGIDLATAINVFLQESLRIGGFPFNIRIEQINQVKSSEID